MPELLVFALSEHHFGLPAEVVVEIVRVVACAPLPGSPEIVEGVIDVRGTLVPVLDVRGRFGLPAAVVDLEQHLILARAGLRVVALRVDRALDLVSVPDGAVVPVERLAPATPLVAGVARLPDGVLVIHDLDRFLSLDEGERLDAALLAGSSG